MKNLTTTLALALALAAPALAVDLHFNFGFADFGDLETKTDYFGFILTQRDNLGSTYYVGGGAGVPVWAYGAGPVTTGFELSTDAAFASKKQEVEIYDAEEVSWKFFTIRENFIFGLRVAFARPYFGVGAGLAVVPWTFSTASGIQLDNHTEVKPAIGVPFGCDFYVAPMFAVGFRAEPAFVLGNITTETQVDYVWTPVPDPFVFAATLRLDL
jgi:hypothetical protein